MKMNPEMEALIVCDKLQIVFSELMTFWLSFENPPDWLVDEYYDLLAQVHMNMSHDKMFEVVSKANKEYYEKIQEKIKSSLDNTPDLF